jgi:hypothetical protein
VHACMCLWNDGKSYVYLEPETWHPMRRAKFTYKWSRTAECVCVFKWFFLPLFGNKGGKVN